MNKQLLMILFLITTVWFIGKIGDYYSLIFLYIGAIVGYLKRKEK